MKQRYRVAELKLEIDSFGKTLRQAEPYRQEFDGPPDGIVRVPRNEAHRRASGLSDEEYEYLYSGFCFGEMLLDHGGCTLHASAIAIDGRAYCFSADSGVGKSTHTRLYREYFGEDRVTIINDDKPVLRPRSGVWTAYGAPWCGKDGLNTNTAYPLGGICFLSRGDENHIARIDAKEAIPLLWRQIRLSPRRDRLLRAMDVMDALIRNVPIWKMSCNMRPEAAAVSYGAMAGKEE